MGTSEPALGIGEISNRTGVGPSTLRMWETRHDFPRPQRLPNGRRVYSHTDLEMIQAVLRGRNDGLSLAAAIDRARQIEEHPQLSVFRTLRERFTHLHPRAMPKQSLLWLSRAVEDECAARAVSPILIGSFQEERFYRQSEHRWRELARGARETIALAGFDEPLTRDGGPAELPLKATDPLLDEWVVICLAENFSVCLTGRQRPETRPSRGFEVIWTLESAAVMEAARICLRVVARSAPGLADDLMPVASGPARPVEASDLQVALDLASRVSTYAAGTIDG